MNVRYHGYHGCEGYKLSRLILSLFSFLVSIIVFARSECLVIFSRKSGSIASGTMYLFMYNRVKIRLLWAMEHSALRLFCTKEVQGCGCVWMWVGGGG